jgi:hypothetical protein
VKCEEWKLCKEIWKYEVKMKWNVKVWNVKCKYEVKVWSMSNVKCEVYEVW